MRRQILQHCFHLIGFGHSTQIQNLACSSDQELALLLKFQVQNCFLQFTTFCVEKKVLWIREEMEESSPHGRSMLEGPPQSSLVGWGSKSIPRVNSIAWFSWSYLVCLEVPKQWIPINKQSSVLKPLSCHLILHYCLPWMFQLQLQCYL